MERENGGRAGFLGSTCGYLITLPRGRSGRGQLDLALAMLLLGGFYLLKVLSRGLFRVNIYNRVISGISTVVIFISLGYKHASGGGAIANPAHSTR